MNPQTIPIELGGMLDRYRQMLIIRNTEDLINELFAGGLVHGTTHLCHGQEALAVGLAAALTPADAPTDAARSRR